MEVSPKYMMNLIDNIEKAILAEFNSYSNFIIIKAIFSINKLRA